MELLSQKCIAGKPQREQKTIAKKPGEKEGKRTSRAAGVAKKLFVMRER